LNAFLKHPKLTHPTPYPTPPPTPPPLTAQVTLEPYERDHAVVCGTFRPSKKE
jgi:hypothetical protein